MRGAAIVTADCDDDGDAGFKGGDNSPVVDQSLAAVLRVTTILGAKQPLAGDLAALSSQPGLKGRVAPARRAPHSLDHGHSRRRCPQRNVLTRHRGGPYSALDKLAVPQLLHALAHPLLPEQVAVVKESGERLAPASRRVTLADRVQHPLDLDHAALGDLHRLVILDPLQQPLREPLANRRLAHLQALSRLRDGQAARQVERLLDSRAQHLHPFEHALELRLREGGDAQLGDCVGKLFGLEPCERGTPSELRGRGSSGARCTVPDFSATFGAV